MWTNVKVPGGDFVHVKAGRKKWKRIYGYEFTAHQSGKHIPNALEADKRPGYKSASDQGGTER
jgi:hypothetical protein